MNDDIKSLRLQALEQSLINYLLNKKDLFERNGVGRRRILSIQLQINAKNMKHLTFIVEMGMFMAEFNMMNGLKERGACFGLERYIRDWSERDSVKSEMLDLCNINGLKGTGNVTNVRNTLR